MRALGRHVILELQDCNRSLLDKPERIRELMAEAACLASATVVESLCYHFTPFGVSGLVVLAESHLSIHTWPEHGYAAVDLFACGDSLDPEPAVSYLVEAFEATAHQVFELKRGLLSEGCVSLPQEPVLAAVPGCR